MDRFANQLGRGDASSNDPELDAMREELNVYYQKEAKEKLRAVLEQKRKQHAGQLNAEQEAHAQSLRTMAGEAGFTIDNRRSE